MKFSKNDLIKYRLDRAFETFEEAKILAEKEHWNAVANRLYYSCFYATNSLFIKKNIITKTHTGTKNQFHLHFIKTKRIDENLGFLYSKLFDLRQSGDYEDFIFHDQESIQPLFPKVENFLITLKNLIETDES
ncbi:MAG: HEPN domain-containing protein [Bacteroidales bacterium]|nr:HEPN domain-containing protein [Bacteroidales bacterium]